MHELPGRLTHRVALAAKLSLLSGSVRDLSTFALGQPIYDIALDLALVLGPLCPPVRAQPLFLTFGFNHDLYRRAPHAKRTIWSTDFISAVVLRARNKSERAACSLQNNAARGTRPIVYELVEQDLGGGANGQVGVIEKHQ